jgi:hypothetical protein
LLPPTRSLKRLGLRGDIVIMLDSPEDTMRLAGTESGVAEIPYEEIESVLVGIVFNKISDYRTIIRSKGNRPLRISGRFANQYSAFIPDLALEMERIGRIDRVRCGVPFMLSWGPFFVLLGAALAGAVGYEIVRAGEVPLMLGAALAGSLLLFGGGLHHYLRWERPRPAATRDGVLPYLPAR